MIGELGELPDLWDFVLGSWEDDSVTARFGEEAEQERYVRGLKALTSKPVVGVGRFTSPDTMVRMVSSGVLDLIGAARPSIADPFLPRKIEEGRLEDIRECIGCNICVSGDFTMSPIRCTQNPVDGRGVAPRLASGADPAAHQRRQGARARRRPGRAGGGAEPRQARLRGDARRIVRGGSGGRVALEARLPGMASYIRVADYRIGAAARGCATSSRPRARSPPPRSSTTTSTTSRSRPARAGAPTASAASTPRPLPLDPALPVLTPDDLMAGAPSATASGCSLFDDDHYYMGGVLAELLVPRGPRR